MEGTTLMRTRQHFTNLLHRASHLRQRFEQESRGGANSPLRLLKLRTLILKIAQHLQRLAFDAVPKAARLQPALAKVCVFHVRRC